MKKIFIFLLTTILSLNVVFSQEDYFQQKVNYEIHTELFPSKNIIKSYETITYKNNSPDTLEFIYFHIWPNAYKNKKTALAKQMAFNGKADLYFNAKEIGGFIDSLEFTSNGEFLITKYDKKNNDICKVFLNEPLLPGYTVKISTPFIVKLPEDVSRMGQKDSTYQITQWFPKPAVYDKYGWHQMPYLNQGEFYSEFGNFDVYITVPKQFVVAATGNLLNKKELKWLKKLEQSKKQGYRIENPAKGDKKTLHYSEKNIHDFAWFCSEKYYVKSDEILTPQNKDTVKTWTFFTNNNLFEWKNAIKYVNAGVKYYSKWVGDYPYNNCTAVEGALRAGGGMEYPTITVISSPSIENVIVHEVGHNWFYGILGFNERRFPMLDEGINTYYDHRYSYNIKNQMPYIGDFAQIPNNNFRGAMQISYLLNSYFGNDQPLNLHSTDYLKLNYALIIYEKMPEALIYLQAYLGTEKFDSIMQAFFEKWKYKHPYPNDFEEFFREKSNKNLDWFFDGYVATNKKVDYKIKYRNNKLIVKNKGDFAAPINIVGFNNDIPVDTTWLEPFEGKKKIPVAEDKYSHFIIDPYFYTMDYNRYNNFAQTKFLFNSFDKFKISLGTGISDYYNKKISFTPLIYYNKYSKFQLGGIITNAKIPPKKFSYYFMPLYSFGYNDFEGSAYMIYKKPGKQGLPGIDYSIYYDRFAYKTDNIDFIANPFRKFKMQIGFNLKNQFASDKYSKKLKFSLSFFNKNTFYYNTTYVNNIRGITPLVNVKYLMQKKSKFRPFYFKINADFYASTYKLWAEAYYKIHYTSLNDGLEIRLFSGSNVPVSGVNGIADFKYQHFFFSRFSDMADSSRTLWSHQFVDNYGGLSYFYPGVEYDFVNAINIKTTIPKVPVIKFYYNFVSGADLVMGLWLDALDFHTGLFETGVMFDIIPHVFAIYFPLYGSENLMDYNNQINNKWYSHFRFTFKLENIEKFINTL